MKGGGGDKQGRIRAPLLQLESQLFRRVSVVVGCFLFVLVFLFSSRHDVAVLDTLSPKASLRTPAAETLLHSSAGLEVGDTTIAADTNGVVREAEPEEAEHHESNAAPSTTNSGNRATPGAAEETVQDNAVHVTAAATAAQPAMETTSSQRELPGNTGIITPRADSVDQRRRPPLCDLSGARADVCDFAGYIRLDANASTFVVVVDEDLPAGRANGTTTTAYKVKPYPRKGDVTAMGRVTEITVRATSNAEAEAAPRCTVTHDAPAVVFSIGGYAGNIFHDFTDVIVPLFGAARRYHDDVQLVVTDANPRWLARYGALLQGLSRHAPLDLAKAAAAGEVHCFARAMVTLRAYRELLIEAPEPASYNELVMPEFTRFLRRALSLPRDAPTRPGNATIKPRLLIISRRGTRRLLNADAVARAAESVGFDAVVRELDVSDDITQVGQLINSFDAMVGVHGAGLTNMVFLPGGATVVQIVPWGGLRWIARLDFGDPAEAMGFRYVQYEVAVEESTLKDKYPRDHEVFTNPTALHKKGFGFMRRTFLNGQDIVVDVERFRPVLLQVLDNLRQTGK
ncbi:hypothetical protein EJB05_31887 [Eragrostis curvula]|uniref:Glycosyltransferase 61 catalytic domain-containing protein n=1 Tax=Eragrostis curvula TaxID=38414 RepID=A0A5J9UEQ1_9POAL|nr:hypothetical protein EJB05_31887 [Eragrostis curvula]